MSDLSTPGGRLQLALRVLIRKFWEDLEMDQDLDAVEFDREVLKLAGELADQVDVRLEELDLL